MPSKGIKFYDQQRQEQRIPLGRVTNEAAQDFCRWVVKLIADKALNRTPDLQTATWLAGLSSNLRQRLAKLGLCDPPPESNSSLLLAHWLTRYLLERESELAPNSIARIRGTIHWLTSYFDNSTTVDQITPDHAKSWRAWLAQQKAGKKSKSKLSEATIRLHCRNAKCIFNDAVARELITRNPFKLLKSTAIAANKNHSVSASDSELIISKCPNLQWQLLFGLTRYAGLRCHSETHHLTWQAVNWLDRTLQVYAPKTKQSRLVPIDPG